MKLYLPMHTFDAVLRMKVYFAEYGVCEGTVSQGFQIRFTLDFLCATGFSDQSLSELRLFGDPQPCIH
ncbi:MAG: hypothetical protein AAFV78_14635, partial [Bacteroidota bacterium]